MTPELNTPVSIVGSKRAKISTGSKRVGDRLKADILALRRTHSLREVAAQTGTPLGTVKTICSRSGAFSDNQALRLLFTLPQARPSPCTALEVPTLPPRTTVTGDTDTDAVLWLRQVISTGQPALIEKAMQVAKRITTPLEVLEKRYTSFLVQQNPGNPMAVAFGSFGFADLDQLAQHSIKRLTRHTEALARFENEANLFADTPAEQFAIDALASLKAPHKRFGQLDTNQVDKRFQAHPELMPHTLSDCLYELAYWDALSSLRSGADRDWPGLGVESYARECFAYRTLARIRPKSKPEAIAVFRYLAASERMHHAETEGVLLNLIG